MKYHTVCETRISKPFLSDFVFVSHLTILFCFCCPSFDGFSVLRFLKPGITSAFSSKQSGAKCVLQTYVFTRSQGFSRRKLCNQTLLSGPFGNLYDNLYLFLWSFNCHLCTKAQYNAAFFVI